MIKEEYSLEDVVKIMSILRGKNGCPWDMEQTHHSIRENFIEEVYEAIEAIDTNDTELLKEELGDVLLQVVFHSKIEEDNGNFSINDVADKLCKKLIVRHPHIFGDVNVNNTEQVLTNWDAIKKKTKGHTTQGEVLQSVSKSLPALMRAEKVQEKAAKVGFDWDNVNGAIDKVTEELNEVVEANQSKDKEKIAEEVGDLIFAAVNVARLLEVEPETACTRACDKFIGRFIKMEKLATQNGQSLRDMTLEEMDKLWEISKQK